MKSRVIKRLLIAVTWLVGGLCFICVTVVGFLGYRFDAKKAEMTTSTLELLAAKLSEFHAATSRWPTNFDELGAYVGIAGLSNDPWGGTFFFDAPEAGTASGRIWSYGKDRSPGGKYMGRDVYITFGTSSDR